MNLRKLRAEMQFVQLRDTSDMDMLSLFSIIKKAGVFSGE